MRRRSLVICGNGASAVALLCALARNGQSPLEVTVVGAGAVPGQGVAYATANANHLLNVPASRMSIDPINPNQFAEWLKERGLLKGDFASLFLPRPLYGEYLQDYLAKWVEMAPQLDVRFRQERVMSLERRGDLWVVHHEDGAVEADIVVLATGNDLPAPIGMQHDAAIRARIIDEPWEAWDVGQDEEILILGTGLTAVDAVIALQDQNHRGRVHLVSRRGLLPVKHVEARRTVMLPPPYPETALGLLRALRNRVGRDPDAADWQALMDSLRPHWPSIWQALPPQEKRRFLRHAATHWGVHRHRIAPDAAARFARAGVTVSKGRLAAIRQSGDGRLAVEIARGRGVDTITVDRLINCTGPNSDPQKNLDPLMQKILAAGFARAGAFRLGLDVDDANRVRGADGAAHPDLFAMGALTRDRWWEITAVPEIARQAVDVASRIREHLSIRDAEHRLATAGR